MRMDLDSNFQMIFGRDSLMNFRKSSLMFRKTLKNKNTFTQDFQEEQEISSGATNILPGGTLESLPWRKSKGISKRAMESFRWNSWKKFWSNSGKKVPENLKKFYRDPVPEDLWKHFLEEIYNEIPKDVRKKIEFQEFWRSLYMIFTLQKDLPKKKIRKDDNLNSKNNSRWIFEINFSNFFEEIIWRIAKGTTGRIPGKTLKPVSRRAEHESWWTAWGIAELQKVVPQELRT